MIFSLFRFHFLIVVGLISIMHAWPATAGERWALLIGNEDYSVLPSLRNPVNDITNFAERLETLASKWSRM